MDELVRAAMRKWPNVPACYGWLALDARGDWYLRDDATQARGDFPHSKGERLTHALLRGFIARNYAVDDQGRWYFQNGPQRVFVDLELTPWVWRVWPVDAVQDDPNGRGVPLLRSHAHAPLGPELVAAQAQPSATSTPGGLPHSTWVDEEGHLYALTDHGCGVVHSLDMHAAAQALEEGLWPAPQPVRRADMPQRFAYQRRPRP